MVSELRVIESFDCNSEAGNCKSRFDRCTIRWDSDAGKCPTWLISPWCRTLAFGTRVYESNYRTRSSNLSRNCDEDERAGITGRLMTSGLVENHHGAFMTER
jgi:hypothetical protein